MHLFIVSSPISFIDFFCFLYLVFQLFGATLFNEKFPQMIASVLTIFFTFKSNCFQSKNFPIDASLSPSNINSSPPLPSLILLSSIVYIQLEDCFQTSNNHISANINNIFLFPSSQHLSLFPLPNFTRVHKTCFSRIFLLPTTGGISAQ